MEQSKIKKLTMCAVMVSLSLVLSYMENYIPIQFFIPLPGIKLGLANVVTLLALVYIDSYSAFTILILRCILSAFFGGGISGLIFSLTGGLLSMSVMSISVRCKRISVYGISILGAAAHNTGQILAAVLLMRSVYAAAYLPYLLLVSIVMGIITGTVCAGFLASEFRNK